jgi:hypothetical protein
LQNSEITWIPGQARNDENMKRRSFVHRGTVSGAVMTQKTIKATSIRSRDGVATSSMILPTAAF